MQPYYKHKEGELKEEKKNHEVAGDLLNVFFPLSLHWLWLRHSLVHDWVQVAESS